MPEQIFNNYSSTLSAGYTAGAGSISVSNATSNGVTLPASGTYTLVVVDQSTKLPKLYYRVSSRSGTTCSGSAEGTDANANSGDLVYGGMLSAAALAQIRADMLGYGSISALPSTTGQTTGNIYIATDTPYNKYVFNGTIWVPFLGGIPCSSPTTSTFATDGSSSGLTINSYAVSNGVLIFQASQTSGTDNVAVKVTSVPTAPYTRTLRCSFNYKETGNGAYPWVGLCLRDSATGKIIVFGPARTDTLNLAMRVGKWTNNTTFSADYYVQNFFPPATYEGVYHLQLTDDNTNRIFKVSRDGYNFETVYSVGRTDFITPDQIGIANIAYTGTAHTTLTVYDYQ